MKCAIRPHMFLGVFFFAAGLVVLGTTPAPMRRDVTAEWPWWPAVTRARRA